MFLSSTTAMMRIHVPFLVLQTILFLLIIGSAKTFSYHSMLLPASLSSDVHRIVKIHQQREQQYGHSMSLQNAKKGAPDFDGDSDNRNFDSNDNSNLQSRRGMLIRLASSSAVVGTTLSSSPSCAIDSVTSPDDDGAGANILKTDSGLKYIDFEDGGASAGYSDATPRYGQICVISYTGYLKLPNSNQNQKFATSTGFVMKHGNGKMIAGLDEGIHSMKRGGLRRLIIPPKLGFVASGLGPMPEFPWQRWKLNSLLENMIAQRGGNLIYDVRLETFFDDEADQGYYEDLDITPEERAELEMRLLKGRTGGGSAVDAVGEDVNVNERAREKPIV
jgi:FKBP-type peptidyl-prolyl cis-trans isomerase